MPEAEPPSNESKTETAAMNLQSLKYANNNGAPQLEVLDQLLLPQQKVYIPVPDVKTAYSVIKTMQIRGWCLLRCCEIITRGWRKI
jgi:hypothetical protein